MSDPILSTARLRLTKLVKADAEAMFISRADPEVCRYQTFEPGKTADVQEWVAALELNAFDTPGTRFQFAIRVKETEEMIGDLGAHFIAEDPRQVEIGFTLAPRHQGKGYATEAVTALLDHLFGELGKHRVFASVDPRNTACLALLERLGLRREAHFHRSLWFKGEWVDDVVYAILRSEWQGR